MKPAEAAAPPARPARAGNTTPPRILIVKLSSLGDVVHTMPAVQDIHRALPDATIDWVVERAFAPLVARCAGVQDVIACDLRQWRAAPFTAQTREQWRAFRKQLGLRQYHTVIDAQGLAKSGLVARLAPLGAGGRRVALANRTEGSSYEAATRWAADVALRVDPNLAAVPRARVLCAQALGYRMPQTLHYGLATADHGDRVQPKTMAESQPRPVALVHGSSRADKCWPVEHWIALGRRLSAANTRIALPHGNEAERLVSEHIAAQVPDAQVWPRLALDALVDRMARCAGVIGVDSGLSHLAVALDLPHVQIYNHDTAWRTGPTAAATRQRAVFALPTPLLDAVWQAWLAVAAGAAGSQSTAAVTLDSAASQR